jgi:hypothetical protein
MLRRVVSYKLTDVSEVITTPNFKAIIALMMEAVSFCETSVSFYENTRRYVPEDSHLYRNICF